MKSIFFIFAFLLLPFRLWAAVTYDTDVTSAVYTGVTDFSASLTVGGGCTNPLLVAKPAWNVNDRNITSVSTSGTGGGALTVAGTSSQAYASPQYQVALYYRAGTTGAQTVTWNFDGVIGAGVGVLESYCGVNQGSPAGTTVTASVGFAVGDPIADVTVSAGGMAIDAVTVYPETTIAANLGQTETENFHDDPGIQLLFGTSYKSCTGTCSMGWTTGTGNETYGIVATPINPSTAVTVSRRRAVVVQ